MKQVPKDHYQFQTYTGFDRWASYFFQIREILAVDPSSMLEVGTGDGFLRRFIKGTTSVDYRSLDVAADLEPDIVGTVESIPLQDDAVDLTVAFEVLEHLPFDRFAPALREMRRVSRSHVFISLPHFGPRPKLAVKVPGIREIRLAAKLPFPREHVFLGEHYWEIGKRGYPVRKVRAVLREMFAIQKDFIPFETQYHHFFLLRK
jgi:SAM-dependent methyltransferase